MKVFVLGYTGMLGRYVYAYFQGCGYDVVGLSRHEVDASKPELPLRSMFIRSGAKKGDVVINCIGTIKSVVNDHGTLTTIRVNSIFPHLLANVCEEKEYHLIHITTDCVFSGNDGNYTEKSPHDCTDVYGKTKSLGEPTNCTVIRTSIIGEEFGTSRSLIEWVKSQDGKMIQGYLNHLWNGLTCHQTAKVFEDIVRNKKYWKGVRHIYTPDHQGLTKNDLVNLIIKVHGLNIEVKPVNAPIYCNRTLATSVYDEETFVPYSLTFGIPDIHTQLEEQYNNPPKLIN